MLQKTRTGTNTNRKDVQRKIVAYSVDRSNLRAPWQNGKYKNKHLDQYKTRINTRHNIKQLTLFSMYADSTDNHSCLYMVLNFTVF